MSLLAAFAVALAGCGGVSALSAHLGRPSSSRAHLGPERSARQAKQLLSRSIAALVRVRSFHLYGTWVYTDGRILSLHGDVSLPGRASFTASTSGWTLGLEVFGRSAYVRSSAAYWVAEGLPPSEVSSLADRWVKVPPGSPNLTGYRALTDPSMLGRCLLQAGERLRFNGRVLLNGVPTLSLGSSQQAHGGASLALYLSAAGAPLPVMMDQWGPGIPHAHADPACGNTHDASNGLRSSMVTFSRYNAPERIRAPQGWVTQNAIPKLLSARVPKSAMANSSQEAVQKHELLGNWWAKGLIVSTHNFRNERKGITVERIWHIGRSCTHGRCHLYMLRESNLGRTSAWLVWAHRSWIADFVQNSPCPDGSLSRLSSHWVLQVASNAINATERDRAGGGTCGSATGLIAWSAHRALRPPDSNGIT